MRIPHDMVHIRLLPRRVPHIAPTRQDTRTRLWRRARRHFAIRRHMPPDLGKQPLDAKMRSETLPLMVEDFHQRQFLATAARRETDNSKS